MGFECKCLQGCVSAERQSVRIYPNGLSTHKPNNTQCYNIISELKQIYSMTMEMFVVESQASLEQEIRFISS